MKLYEENISKGLSFVYQLCPTGAIGGGWESPPLATSQGPWLKQRPRTRPASGALQDWGGGEYLAILFGSERGA